MRQCRHQRHADHVSRLFIRGLLSTDIHHGGLYATHDDLGRVVQRTVPVESDQIKSARAQGVGHGL